MIQPRNRKALIAEGIKRAGAKFDAKTLRHAMLLTFLQRQEERRSATAH